MWHPDAFESGTDNGRPSSRISCYQVLDQEEIQRNAAWSEAETYAINILHEHQDAVSTRFAGTRTDKWEGTKPVVGQTGALIIPGALASFECENYARYDGGDHLILVGKVSAMTTASVADPRPLVFYRGSYQKIERYDTATPRDLDLDYVLHGW